MMRLLKRLSSNLPALLLLMILLQAVFPPRIKSEKSDDNDASPQMTPPSPDYDDERVAATEIKDDVSYEDDDDDDDDNDGKSKKVDHLEPLDCTKPNMLYCSDNKTCFDELNQKCDGRRDCDDNTDERGCCHRSEFECSDEVDTILWHIPVPHAHNLNYNNHNDGDHNGDHSGHNDDINKDNTNHNDDEKSYASNKHIKPHPSHHHHHNNYSSSSHREIVLYSVKEDKEIGRRKILPETADPNIRSMVFDTRNDLAFCHDLKKPDLPATSENILMTFPSTLRPTSLFYDWRNEYLFYSAIGRPIKIKLKINPCLPSYVYWIEEHGFFRMGMDGTGIERLFPEYKLNPRGITHDYIYDGIYIIDWNRGTLYEFVIDDFYLKVILTYHSLELLPRSIVYHQDYLIWYAPSETDIQIFTRQNNTIVKHLNYKTSFIAVQQDIAEIDELDQSLTCSDKSHSCSDICLPLSPTSLPLPSSSSSFVCACLTTHNKHYKLSDDGLTCVEDTDVIHLYTDDELDGAGHGDVANGDDNLHPHINRDHASTTDDNIQQQHTNIQQHKIQQQHNNNNKNKTYNQKNSAVIDMANQMNDYSVSDEGVANAGQHDLLYAFGGCMIAGLVVLGALVAVKLVKRKKKLTNQVSIINVNGDGEPAVMMAMMSSGKNSSDKLPLKHDEEVENVA
ncbi:hypothetical protein HELRODRAFT_191152 [Helobdella robusta]|uniref:Uncharacterized protein n=1 Tax=Helobdella robusta TaxID=6412 RepID=T1FSN5_HELRO|nr:hypothetical protein HELRODRAFT_191152 [Helobdella robusta]ESO07348.1 hypothetical protein HELRODRAFT_191152 [Helobdella robusta]